MKDKIRRVFELIVPPVVYTLVDQVRRLKAPRREELKVFMRQVLPPICILVLQRLRSKGATVFKGKKRSSEERSGILEKAREHFDKMIVFETAGALPSPSLRWQAYLEKMRNKIKKIGSVEEAIFCCQREIGFDHRIRSAGLEAHFHLCEQMLKSEFPRFVDDIEKVSDSSHSLRDTLYEQQGRLLSNVIYWQVRYVLQCLTYIKEPKIVCEIGAGYGGLARLWLNNTIHCPDVYVIVDLPESLFFAEVFLRLNFDNLKLLYITEPSSIDLSRVSQYTVVLCPIACVDALRGLPLDLVINTGSMQEMTEDWVDFWMEWLSKQNCHYFYSLNYFAQPLNFMAEGANAWSPRCPPVYKAVFQAANPRFIRLQTDRNFAEILFEKEAVRPCDKEDGGTRSYQEKRSRTLDNQVLLESFDIVRRNPDEDMMWDLLQRCVSEPLVIPKEAYYLVERLSKHASVEFKRSHGKRLEELHIKLTAMRSKGKENVTEDVHQ